MLKFRKPEKKRFEYKPLTSAYMKERRNQSGSDRDPYVDPRIKLYSPGDGDNCIRLLPAGWEGGSYGFEVFVHYGIGADRSTYVCPKAFANKPCPICKEKAKAEREGDDEYAQAMRAGKRIAVYVIDRGKEGDGPKLWLMPFTLEREIAAQAINKKTGEVLQFIDPEEGYDLNYEKKGKQKTTKYIGVSFDRDPSPLSDDDDTLKEWLEYASDNPIPEVFVVHDAEHIKKQFEGVEEPEEERKGWRKGGEKSGRFRLGKKMSGRLNLRSSS